MRTQSLLTTAGLAVTSVAAQTTAAADPISQALSKVDSEAESIALQNTGAANAVYSWQAEQTAVSQSVIQSQNDDYLYAHVTATATGLPAYVTAVPTSLQPYVSSILAGEATLVMSEVAPIVSSLSASASVSANSSTLISSAKSTAAATAAGTFATSAVPSNSANSTGSITTSTPSSSSTPPSPPPPKKSSGADRNGVLVAAGVVGVGLAALMSLL